jgi:ribose-phosphate pyrophosphokinase
MTNANMMLFAGNANLPLAHAIAAHLDTRMGKANVGHFSDGETMVEILENVRGKHVYILQPTSAPSNDHLMELFALADALRRASAIEITAVIPYFGYARQDRRVRSARVPITAKIIADMMSCVGITRLVTVELHADQIQGFFDIPVDNVYGTGPMLNYIHRRSYKNPIIVSPDVGGVVRARAIAKRLNDCDLAIIDKRRAQANKSEVMNIIGDVASRTCLIMDDIVDTAGTLCNAAFALKERGALAVEAFCTHPVLSGKAIENIENAPLDKLIVSDTIPLSAAAAACSKIEVVSMAELLAHAIRRVHVRESLSSLFDGVM